MAIVAVTTVAVGAVVLGAAEVGAAVTGAGVLIQAGLRGARHWWRDQRVAARVDLPDGRRVALALQHTARAELHADAANGWRLDVPYLGVGTRVVEGFTGRRHVADVAQLTGDHARRAMSVILPSLNPWGGGERRVQDAVTLLDRAGTSPTDYFGIVARVPRTKPRTNYGFTDSTLPLLRTLPPAVRLALEMASHEESERRALDGELAVLETAWREAEEIAAIADDMFLPASVTAWLDRPHARRNAGPRE